MRNTALEVRTLRQGAALRVERFRTWFVCLVISLGFWGCTLPARAQEFEGPTPISQTIPSPGKISPGTPFPSPSGGFPQGQPYAGPGNETIIPPGTGGQHGLLTPTPLPPPQGLVLYGEGKCGPDGVCPPGVGHTPQPSPKILKKYQQFIEQVIEAEVNLDLFVGKTKLMKLKKTPKRVQIGDDNFAGYTLLSTREISLQGKEVGTTVLTLWFPDPSDPQKEEVLSYNIRVFPDPEHAARLKKTYEKLSYEINCLFKDSNVCLKVVGDKLVVTGFAHDMREATQIMRIVRANAPDPRNLAGDAARIPFDPRKPLIKPGDAEGLKEPGVEDYGVSGGPQVINLLQIPGEQQVMLRVTVAEVNRAAARSIGMNFTITNNDGAAVFANNTGLIANGGVAPSPRGNGLGAALGLLNFAGGNTFGISPLAGFPSGTGGFNNLPAALDNGQVRLAISALRNLNYARSLAEPNLVTMNGQTANFSAGGQFPVPVVTGIGIGGLQGVDFVPFGVQLSFTPYITDRDRIKLFIAAEVSSRDLDAGNTNIGGAAIPNLISRNFQTVVELREGQTLAVAGLIQNNLGADSSRIPFLGEIPILNRLTGLDRITAGEQELVVLITPELVHPMEHEEVPPLPGSDLFEPNDLEFYLWGRLESHHPRDYRSPIRTDWGRMRQYHTMEEMYLSGQHGYIVEP